MPAEKPDYVARLNRYARAVVSGGRPAGKYEQLACARHLADLKRSRADKSYPYYFDTTAVKIICGFGEMLPHVKGQWAKRGELLHLEPWECFVIGVPFGWKRRKDKRRRFREMYAEIPRKNGKSIVGAVIGNYMFIADGEHGAEVYSGATTMAQAWEVFGPARQMLVKADEVREGADVEVTAQSMFVVDNNSKFQPIIGNPGDGASPSCAIIDEYHEHLNANQYDTMQTGMGAREQPMLVIITTAGTDTAGPCFDKHTQAGKVLDGTLENDELFTIIYAADAEDDWAAPATLIKANPNYGVSVDADFLTQQQRQAVLNAEQQNRFKTKHLNIWCSAKEAWMNSEWWRLCGDAQLSLDEFCGEPCIFILDLASRDDVCAFVQLFWKQVGEHMHYYAFGKFYLPEDTIEEPGPNQGDYRKWLAQGWLTATDGSAVDFERVRDDVMALKERHHVVEILTDDWQSAMLQQQFMKAGATVVSIPMTAKQLSPAMREMMVAVKAGRFHHNGDPVLSWMVSNVVAKADANDNLFPRKNADKGQYKIDGAVCIIMGVARAMVNSPEPSFDDFLKNPIIRMPA